MKFGYEHEEAVSPVIGVILMVAITVILAAIVGMFVLNMGNEMQGPKDIALTASTNSTAITIILQSGKDLSGLQEMSIKVNGSAVESGVVYNGNDTVDTTDGILKPAEDKKFSSGDVIILTDNSKGPIVVAGKFADGDEKVILQKTL
ncbi:type IV pilin N-terminal domain-containing protein [Methanofollis sp. UBA420]|jgi:flagellin-like protein|uniref:type IV pilin N-terminal domain-containing protein n=1 Tax=Methanofollis sp. UBA420 TaxID=1915514 RepID=UPI00316AE724